MEVEETRTEPIQVSTNQIRKWLKEGVTRRKGDSNYNPELGSVEEKYGMSVSDVNLLFKDYRLRGLKVITPKPKSFVIIEDMEDIRDIPSGEGSISSHVAEEQSDSLPVSETDGESPVLDRVPGNFREDASEEREVSVGVDASINTTNQGDINTIDQPVF